MRTATGAHSAPILRAIGKGDFIKHGSSSRALSDLTAARLCNPKMPVPLLWQQVGGDRDQAQRGCPAVCEVDGIINLVTRGVTRDTIRILNGARGLDGQIPSSLERLRGARGVRDGPSGRRVARGSGGRREGRGANMNKPTDQLGTRDGLKYKV